MYNAFATCIAIAGNVQNMKPVQKAQVSYFEHFPQLYGTENLFTNLPFTVLK